MKRIAVDVFVNSGSVQGAKRAQPFRVELRVLVSECDVGRGISNRRDRIRRELRQRTIDLGAVEVEILTKSKKVLEFSWRKRGQKVKKWRAVAGGIRPAHIADGKCGIVAFDHGVIITWLLSAHSSH